MGSLVIFGLGNMLSDIFDCALALGHDVVKIVRNQPQIARPRTKGLEERIVLLPRPPAILDLGGFAAAADEIYALGTTGSGRGLLVERLWRDHGVRLTTLVHPTAYVSPLARLGAGVFVGARSVIAPGAEIGDHVFVNRSVTVGHDTVVEPFVRLQPGCNVGGHVRVGRGVTVGMGANVIEERVVGSGSMVAAGAVVIDDVPPDVLVAGVPARVKKTLPAVPAA